MKTLKRMKRGIVGIEAAIVLIAFVVVAAALAFVVLNMGFTTTQKSKEAMASGLKEASTALEVDGSVLAYAESSGAADEIVIPIKVAPGRGLVDLHPARASILYWTSEEGFQDIYVAYGYVYFSTTTNTYQVILYDESDNQLGTADTSVNVLDVDKIRDAVRTIINASSIGGDGSTPDIYAVVLWINSLQSYTSKDSTLEFGEKAITLIDITASAYKLGGYEVFKVEIKPPEGAPLTVERSMPPSIDQGVLDLG